MQNVEIEVVRLTCLGVTQLTQGHRQHNHSIDRIRLLSFYSNLIETTRLSCTVFEILSPFFQNLKRSRHVTMTTPLSETICRP